MVSADYTNIFAILAADLHQRSVSMIIGREDETLR